ncbi:MAG: hypothetical protein M1819_007448 [Sarea resinae]|nr:MAG: hypothetical protein M1819_007448 [Sarea resinae]
MFYKPGTPHNLPRDPFKACVIPRPIGWISSVSRDGVPNLAPYSQFNNLTFDPPYVMFSANQTHENKIKDSARNAQETGFFVWNLATWDTREAVNKSAQYLAADVDEFEVAGVTKEPSEVYSTCPRVKESPVHFDCKYHTTVRLPGNPPMGTVDVIIAEVVGIHIADDVLTDGLLDVRKTQPIARCGYHEYAVVRETFEMIIPSIGPGGKEMLSGLEGSAKDNRAMMGAEKGA